MSQALLEKILTDLPEFHRGDTETTRIASEEHSSLRGPILENLKNRRPACYGIDAELAHFLYDSVSSNNATLETGSGISTLVFALRHSNHITVTPSCEEMGNITQYAALNQIPLDSVEFALEPSDQYLPRCQAKDLDLVLIDGKHAFP